MEIKTNSCALKEYLGDKLQINTGELYVITCGLCGFTFTAEKNPPTPENLTIQIMKTNLTQAKRYCEIYKKQ